MRRSVDFDELHRPVEPNRARPLASFVIPTCNRVEELRALLRSLDAQTIPVEILVMDDGSSGAAAELVRLEFPEVRYYNCAIGRGPAFQRNLGIELATTEVVFSPDDDTLFISPQTVEQTLAEFDDPRIGAVGIPFMNVRLDQQVQHRGPTAESTWIAHAFVGAAHAVRRSAFIKAGGYRAHFFYMGEEGDLCLRLLSMGYLVRLGTSDPIHHLESPKRNLKLAAYCGRRNDILFTWHNVPLLFLPFHLAGTTLQRRALGPKGLKIEDGC